MPAAPTAERLQSEALRLESEIVEHARDAKRARNKVRKKRERLNALKAECSALGIRLNLTTTIPTQAIGGQSDPSSSSPT